MRFEATFCGSDAFPGTSPSALLRRLVSRHALLGVSALAVNSSAGYGDKGRQSAGGHAPMTAAWCRGLIASRRRSACTFGHAAGGERPEADSPSRRRSRAAASRLSPSPRPRCTTAPRAGLHPRGRLVGKPPATDAVAAPKVRRPSPPHTFSVRDHARPHRHRAQPAPSPPPPPPRRHHPAADLDRQRAPANETHRPSASFGFSSERARLQLRVQARHRRWAAAASPEVYSGLALGSHKFSVRATDAAGNVDATPASRPGR